MKKILSLVLVLAMIAAMSVSVFAAQTAFVEVASYDFSNTEGLKGYTATWPGVVEQSNATEVDMTANVVDGKLVTGNGAFVADSTIDGTNGVKITYDVVFDSTQVVEGDQPWNWNLVNVVSMAGATEDFLALDGSATFTEGFGGYYNHMKNIASHVQFKFMGVGVGEVWGGDPAENLENGKTYAVEFAIVPAEEGVTVTFKVDGADVGLPNNPELIPNLLSDEMLVFIGGTVYGDMPKGVQIDNVKVYTMQEVQNTETGAPQTGVATVVLAVAAMLSGAYIVSKKH